MEMDHPRYVIRGIDTRQGLTGIHVRGVRADRGADEMGPRPFDTEELVDVNSRIAVGRQNVGSATKKSVGRRHAVRMKAEKARRRTTFVMEVEATPQA